MEIIQQDKAALFKIVYYGPALGGKTTNLTQIFARLTPEQKLTQEIIVIPTQLDRTLSFECIPLTIGKVGMYTVKLTFYTVPGQVHYENSRKLILKGADGVVFVADSQPEMRQQNIAALGEMKEYLKNENLENIPLLLQFNKRDLPGVMPVEKMIDDLQSKTAEESWYEAMAINGTGVMETMRTITQMAISNIKKKQ